ncbi:HAD family phosphatase [Leptolyngbya sp. FACHB-261]|uniref:HAD family hydrolase n=1 Tax=Leptolyngbya sp. FACHB-261 TaxID=2692806 RepID=UPI0016847213|nr:HAD family phosphatase [Leptolyngbya sp. FACHB-261]MBD2101435.1 HAD family phosphatase [Leptolyngbya sp. FACHB-261]
MKRGKTLVATDTLFVFDLMGTVVVDPFYEVLPAHLGVSFQELLALKHPTIWVEFERGLRSEAEFLANFFHPESGRTLDAPEALVTAYTDAFDFMPGMESLLTELVDQGYPLWVLSNYPNWYEIARRKLKLDRFFEKYVVSCDIRHRKPEPAAFQAVLDLANRPAAQCIFVDDRQVNVDAAEQLGFQALLYRDTAELRRDLEQLRVS